MGEAMSIPLPDHQTSLIIFLAVLLAIAVSNAVTVRRPRRRSLDSPPRVSVLVPARNEADCIEACLTSLLDQDYPDCEVLVLDDESSDGTGEVLARLARAWPRLRILAGAPRPGGWLGKHWACHQLARAADGDLLLFTDADTVHARASVGDAATTLRADGIALLTAIPEQDVRTFGEKLLVPPLLWAVMSFFPLPLASKLRLPALAVANGQFLLFERSAYERIGGHEAVRTDVVDDVALAKRAVAAGFPVRLHDGRRLFRCRMYRGFREAWAGFTKNLFAIFGYSVPLTVFVWVWVTLVFIEPLVVLAVWTGGGNIVPLRPQPAAVAAALGLALWLIAYARFGLPLWLALLYPVKVVLYAALAFRSMWGHLTGTAEWKGRVFRGRRA
ncbi:MAG: glycosyltransferase [Acidobacteria bacterium]|nr:glycosyltransferase [Acidobacteriota bacterium]